MRSAIETLLELLNVVSDLESALGADWPQWRDRLALLVQRIGTEDETRELARAAEAFIEELSETSALDILRRATGARDPADDIDDGAERVRGARWRWGARQVPAPEISIVKAPEPAAVAKQRVAVRVFFGTNRARNDEASAAKRFTGERGDAIQFGVAQVSIPLPHRVGVLEGPRLWRLELSDDAEKHVVVSDVKTLAQDQFTQQLRSTLEAADERDVLLFVHGYNVSFEDALRRAGQLGHDLKFPGSTALFTWPSMGNVLDYLKDGANAEWSEPYFREFLELLLTKVGARRVHAIAHSMGNRLLVDAVERLDTSAAPAGSGELSQVVFAAPDVDAEVFVNKMKVAAGRARGFTLYLSSNDLALLLSRMLHGHGRGGGTLLAANAVHTIDASRVDTSLFGLRHSYFSGNRSMLSDIHALISTGLAPSRRFDLDATEGDTGRYWVYRE
ncbi:alpha/beta hydrolase [Burkholderia ubonensis]|uniref:alpha/beta hydrolase n=1 Tax=Burkholderia ubonensis TaxID=101571 RepID=UPI000A4C581E|nr:alpha/beta hydrolase [Burkholderia ubonensis]